MKQEHAETAQLQGRWRLTAVHKTTGERVVKEGKNLIVNSGKALVGDMLIDESGYDTGLTYCAIGSGNDTRVVSDTTLDVEEARKAITSKSRSGNEITFSTFFTALESKYAIEEAGIFGHSTASATLNSGELFAYWLVSFDNGDGLYDLTFDYVLTIG